MFTDIVMACETITKYLNPKPIKHQTHYTRTCTCTCTTIHVHVYTCIDNEITIVVHVC